jgi:hypothetical protein
MTLPLIKHTTEIVNVVKYEDNQQIDLTVVQTVLRLFVSKKGYSRIKLQSF